MFQFGSIEEQARLYIDNALTVRGPADDETSNDIMSLRNRLAYRRIACDTAMNEDASELVIEKLVEIHDTVFAELCYYDEEFRERVLNSNKIRWLGGYEVDNINKYKSIALAASAN